MSSKMSTGSEAGRAAEAEAERQAAAFAEEEEEQQQQHVQPAQLSAAGDAAGAPEPAEGAATAVIRAASGTGPDHIEVLVASKFQWGDH
tara:strand:- start:97 stop:363 length:267 start_codon:yes stop_codon:yes gene_type:complete